MRGAALAVAGLVLGMVLSALLGPLSATPAGASSGACPDDRGVTVVVDFQSLGAGTIVACTDGPVGSGFEALSAAGIAYRTVTSQPGFLCTIQGLPSSETCTDTPPGDAYWSYWTGTRGGGWQYSQRGAASRVPPEGSVEGWSFSNDPINGTPPRTAPPAAPAPEPTPTPTPTGEQAATAPEPPPAQPQPAATSGSGVGGQATTRPGTAQATTPASAPTTAPAETTAPPQPIATPTPTPTQTPALDPDATAQPASPPPTPSEDATDGPADEPTDPPTQRGLAVDPEEGPPVSTMVGTGLVLSGATAALVLARRRRPE